MSVFPTRRPMEERGGRALRDTAQWGRWGRGRGRTRSPVSQSSVREGEGERAEQSPPLGPRRTDRPLRAPCGAAASGAAAAASSGAGVPGAERSLRPVPVRAPRLGPGE